MKIMICMNCGNQIPDSVKFCTRCGKAVIRLPEQQQNQQNQAPPVYQAPQNRFQPQNLQQYGLPQAQKPQTKAFQNSFQSTLKSLPKWAYYTLCCGVLLGGFIVIFIIYAAFLQDNTKQGAKEKPISATSDTNYEAEETPEAEEESAFSEDDAIALVKAHKIPEGITVMEKIEKDENMNYGSGEWIAYPAGEKTDCPNTDDPKIDTYADWVVCYKTVFEIDGASFPQQPTWTIRKEKVYSQNGIAASLTDEDVAPEEGYAEHSEGKYSAEGKPPTKFECTVEKDFSKIFEEIVPQEDPELKYPEKMQKKAANMTAEKHGITSEQVIQIENKIFNYNNADGENRPRACPPTSD